MTRTILGSTVALVAMGVVAAAIGCGGGGDVDTTPVPAAWTADIRALGEAGHSGFATVSIMTTGNTRVNVTLSGGSAGGVHPWHVHAGLCGSGGPIVGDADAYEPLRPDEAGNASATATLDVSLDPEADYYINIHQSPDDLGTIVGCGELVRS